MKTLEESRALWKEHVERLQSLPCENAEPSDLDAIERVIQRFPYASIPDACMQINGGWISGARYDLCVAWLLQNGCLDPDGSGLFRINRRKLPLIEVENPIADGIDAASRPPVRQEVSNFQGNLF